MSDTPSGSLPQGEATIPQSADALGDDGSSSPFFLPGHGPLPSFDAGMGKTSEISALYRLTNRLYRANGLSETYEAAFDAIAELLGASRSAILLFDGGGTMRFVAWRGLSDAYRRAATGHSPWQPGESDAEPILLGDITEAPELGPLKSAILEEGIRALAFIPLTNDDTTVFGTFMAYYEAPVAFTGREQELAQLIARQLSFSIQRHASEQATARLAVLVESSDDAIIATNLFGTIISWNGGAEALFGHSADEIVGQPISILHPPHLQTQEAAILDHVRRGQRFKSYETVRHRKNLEPIDVSLTISPILDRHNQVIGISKIARDITERRLAQEQQELLLREVNHRIKNLFTLANSIVSLSARTAETPQGLAHDVSKRLTALSSAHALTMRTTDDDGLEPVSPSLHALISAILEPYARPSEGSDATFAISGLDTQVGPAAVTPIALMLHEFATNAAKYGALSQPDGHIDIRCSDGGTHLLIHWKEQGGPLPRSALDQRDEGFGSQLARAAVQQLGDIHRQWEPDGLAIELTLDKARLLPPPAQG